MNSKEIKEQGFSFGKIDPSKELIEILYSLPWSFSEEDGGNAKQSGEHVLPGDNWISIELRSLVLELCEDEDTFESVSRMEFTANRTMPGDFINLHKDKPNYSREYSHLNIWLPRDTFEGRDFIYGKAGHFKRMKPSLGDCVLINNELNGFIHAVSPMLSGREFVSVNGYQMIPGEDMPHKVIYYKTDWNEL